MYIHKPGDWSVEEEFPSEDAFGPVAYPGRELASFCTVAIVLITLVTWFIGGLALGIWHEAKADLEMLTYAHGVMDGE